ncbi:hypothetical protein COOONC_17548 [Cooperia oncophora]
MSYSNTFQDYLRDIPMEIGRRFYPPPLINLPTLTIPEPLKSVQYAFEAEKRAREQFDEANNKPEQKPEISRKNPINGVTSSDSQASSTASITNEVLLPCAAPPATPAPARPPAPFQNSVSFEEFEGRGTVFDELEWRTIDDKLALSQILGNVSLQHSKSVENPSTNPVVDKKPDGLANGSKAVPIPAIPPYPVLDFGRFHSRGLKSVILNT